MQRRVIAAVAAVLLAGIGAVLLYSYVTTADRRAMAGQEPTDVLVVTKVVPNGTTAADIPPFVEVRQLPKAAIVPGALTNTTDVVGLATTSELQIGEQLLSSRFADPATTAVETITVPADKQEVSIQMEAQRVVGSTIVAGDKVGIFVTVDDETRLVYDDVLVIRTQGGLDPAAADSGVAPSGGLMLTLALDAKDAERFVWIAEHAKMWMSKESKGSSGQSTKGVNAKNVFK